MDFQKIIRVEKPQAYLDNAFHNARQKAPKSSSIRDPAVRVRLNERQKIKVVAASLTNSLDKILTSFPQFDALPEFYQELVKAMLDYRQLKKSLGAITWAQKQIGILHKKATIGMKSRNVNEIIQQRTVYYGRVASVIKQISPALEYLEQVRKTMRTFPNIKPGLKTIVILGFPNTGKTTLLSKLTTAKPKIAAYPFTTQTINTGYATQGSKTLQILDTPGTLNRYEKMNPIEKQAIISIKLADCIVYVFDPTEEYPIDQQIKLYKKLLAMHKQVVVFLSKTDLVSTSEFEIYQPFTDPEKLKAHLFSLS
ncbi:MAG: GTPase [Candidatus Woesearchaeota archaeon]